MERFGLDIDGTPLLSMSARRGRLLGMDRLEHGHAVIRDLCRQRLNRFNKGQEPLDSAFHTYEKRSTCWFPILSPGTAGSSPESKRRPNRAHHVRKSGTESSTTLYRLTRCVI